MGRVTSVCGSAMPECPCVRARRIIALSSRGVCVPGRRQGIVETGPVGDQLPRHASARRAGLAGSRARSRAAMVATHGVPRGGKPVEGTPTSRVALYVRREPRLGGRDRREAKLTVRHGRCVIECGSGSCASAADGIQRIRIRRGTRRLSTTEHENRCWAPSRAASRSDPGAEPNRTRRYGRGRSRSMVRVGRCPVSGPGCLLPGPMPSAPRSAASAATARALLPNNLSESPRVGLPGADRGKSSPGLYARRSARSGSGRVLTSGSGVV